MLFINTCMVGTVEYFMVPTTCSESNLSISVDNTHSLWVQILCGLNVLMERPAHLSQGCPLTTAMSAEDSRPSLVESETSLGGFIARSIEIVCMQEIWMSHAVLIYWTVFFCVTLKKKNYKYMNNITTYIYIYIYIYLFIFFFFLQK